MLSVRVLWRGSRKPVEGSSVAVGTFYGVTDPELTDEDGIARFPDVEEGQECNIYIDGTERYEGAAEEEMTFLIDG